MQAEIKAAIDEIAETRDIYKSVLKGFAMQQLQIADLQKKVDDLVAAGSPVSPGDLAALSAAVKELDESNKDLVTAIPAGTSGGFEESGNGPHN